MAWAVWSLAFVAVAGIANVGLAAAVQQANPRSEILVDSAWVESNVGRADVRLICLEKTQEQFAAGHIPGGHYVDWKTELTDPKLPHRYNLPPKSQIEQLLSRLGVTRDTTVVLSDGFFNRLSTRMYWTLKSYGHTKLKILEGGRLAWQKSGRPFTTTPSQSPAPTTYKTLPLDKQSHADLAAVKQSVIDGDVLIDGRPVEQFTGDAPGKTFHTKKEHKRRGHITNAKNVPWLENFTDDGKFKSNAQLKKLYESAGATPGRKVVTYCNEGLHAAPAWFVMKELLGYPNVRVYDSSMTEWANDDSTPMEKSPAKR